MPKLLDLLRSDLWEEARELGILPPRLDFVSADQLEAERREDRERTALSGD